MNEIIPNLFVGNWQDALDQKGKMDRLCVLEGTEGMEIHVSILTFMPHPRVSRKSLEEACWHIDKYQKEGRPLLVHCAAGIERSPLTVVYWMWTRGLHSTIKAAYAHVMAIRPEVADRTEWLDPSLVLHSSIAAFSETKVPIEELLERIYRELEGTGDQSPKVWKLLRESAEQLEKYRRKSEPSSGVTRLAGAI